MCSVNLDVSAMFSSGRNLLILSLAPLHLILTISIKGSCSTDTETSITADLNSFSASHTSGESDQDNVAIRNASIRSSLPKHFVKRGDDKVETTEKGTDYNFSERDITKTSVCSNISADGNTEYGNFKSVMENEERQLSVINDTMKRILMDIYNLTWLFINEHDENVGHEAVKLSHGYLQQARNYLNKIREFNSCINEYNCKFTRLTPCLDTIPQTEYEDQVRQKQNIIIRFQQLHGLISDYYRMQAVNDRAENLTKEYNEFRHLTDLQKSIEAGEFVKEMIANISENVKITNNFSRTYNLEHYFDTKFTKQLLDLNFWKSQLQNKTKALEEIVTYLEQERVRILFHDFLQPIIHGMIFVIGFVGNGVMMIIFAREKGIRTAINMTLLNLAVADMLNLILNIPVFYSYTVSRTWQFGLHLCKAYRFLRQLGISVSIYSIVVLSVQRFISVRQLDSCRCYGCRIPKNLKLGLIILFTWLNCSIMAVPHTLHAGIYEENCYAGYDQNYSYWKTITLTDLLLFCVIPLSIIALFSVSSACHLKRSIRNLPGERVGMETFIHARLVSSNVLIVLAIVSAVSYIPFYVLLFIYTWTSLKIQPVIYYVVFTITYTLIFGNSCFNPIALYIVSSKFRSYFNRYLLCRREGKTSDNQDRTLAASSLTIETRI